MLRKRGFTLIELLVVISIIALLLSILMPALSKVKQQGQSIVCRSNLHQWYVCLNLYTADNDEKFWCGWGNNGSESNWWMAAMRSYYENVTDIRCCPTARLTTYEADNATPGPGAGMQPFAAWGLNEALFSSVDPEYGDDFGSYVANAWLENANEKPVNFIISLKNSGNFSKFWNKSSRVTTPSKVPFMTDGLWLDAMPDSSNLTPPPTEDELIGNSGNPGVTLNYGDAAHLRRVVQNRHGKGIQNMVFMDGVASKVGVKELWTFKWYQGFDTRNGYTLAGGSTETWPDWMKGFTEY